MDPIARQRVQEFRVLTTEIRVARQALHDAQTRLDQATDALGHLSIEALTS